MSQNLLPRMRTNTNMKVMADASLTRPKMPVRNNEEEAEVKPAVRKITGA